MLLQPKIRQAVEAEIQYAKEEKAKQEKLSPNELRTLGIAIFPLECKKTEEFGNALILHLKASFHINDQFIYNGCKLVVHVNDSRINGRLSSFSAQELQVRIDDEIDFNPLDFSYRVDFESDDKTFKCMELGIQFLESKPFLQELEQHLINDPKTDFEPTEIAHLNHHQKEVVSAILSDRKTVCIQGPPGTGKTTTLVQAIEALTKQGKQVIVCAPSNTAVDNICVQLITEKIELLRFGNDEKIHPVVIPFTPDGHVQRSHGKTIEHIKKSMQKALQVATRSIRNYTPEAKQEKRAAQQELRQLRSESRALERQIVQNLVESVPVIAGTPVSLFNHLPKEKTTDLVIIDEAGQCLSPLAWLAASFGKRLVLCGDPQQLPPVVFSPKAKELGLGKSLLEAACEKQSPYLLKEQYRMGEEIVSVINSYFYNDELITYSGNKPANFYFIDMAGYGDGEQKDEISGSTYNLSEIEIVQKSLEYFELDPKETVILSPYNAQLDELEKVLGTKWKLSTIDSIQGQEATSIVISLTRANEEQEIGFLKDYRRTNVAVSRSKECCVVIGDSSTIGSNPFYNAMIQHAEKSGSYKSAYELL